MLAFASEHRQYVTTVTATSLLKALGRVRLAAQRHMDERDESGLGWVEESVTDASIHKGLPQVRVIQFTRHQEGGGVGADYLWWWLDRSSDECFGMLVQAKRLSRSNARWTIDVGHRGGRQFRDLLQTAEYFEVPAVFAVYMGGRVFRSALPCSHDGEPDCRDCERMAISIIGAYQVSVSWESPADTAATVLSESLPLENLVDPETAPGAIWDVNMRHLGPELRQFLEDDQDGPRDVARRIFGAVARQRMGAFSAAVAERTTLPSSPIFAEVPRDRGHYPGPYFSHFLRGLRNAPPAYVRDIEAGLPVDPEVANRVAGVVLIRA
jgi:hypothetical protein